MDCNRYSTICIEPDYTTPKCQRARLDTGTFCNYDCEFCYYQGELHKVTNFNTIKKRVDILYKYGIKEVDLSGGESSVHKQWFDILDYCNDRFEHISTLTNGWAFARESFLVESKKHGLKEILFSVHGYDEESHDDIVRRKGAWQKIMKAIKLAHQHNIIVRVNCTVYQRNCSGLLEYHNIIKELNPLEVNFLTLNYWTNNRHASPIDYKEVTDNIKICIDSIKDHVKYINVRYTPYCYMKGYEQYVCNQFQHIYDRYDWNKEIYGYNLDVDKKYSHKEKIDLGYKEAAKIRIRDYKKPIQCIGCKYYYICDGMEKEVKNVDVLPEPGKKITNVVHFRKDMYT